MGQGIKLARDAGAPLHAQVIDDFKEQLLLVLIERLGGSVDIPVAECDDTGGKTLALRVSMEPVLTFHFTVNLKQ